MSMCATLALGIANLFAANALAPGQYLVTNVIHMAGFSVVSAGELLDNSVLFALVVVLRHHRSHKYELIYQHDALLHEPYESAIDHHQVMNRIRYTA